MNELEIFSAATEIASPRERARYLDQACGDDTRLRKRIKELLRSHDNVGSFMDSPAPDFGVTAQLRPITEKPGSVIGRYELIEEIGEGGMGIVYVAQQQEPVRRKVALKIIKPGMDSREVVARFEAERQALALMDHPNIARVLDAGATPSPPSPFPPGVKWGEGRPYFVMELVHGIPITDYCDQNHLTTRQRLELFVSVCQAIQHAHQKGIIHRDVKPTNVLVTLNDGVPVPKVIDFGVAKAINQQLTERTVYTRFTQMVGTPLYMSPEQAERSELDVDTRSDVYSLGVLLYELLTGATPFDQKRIREAAYDELLKIIREEEPPKPSTRVSTLGKTANSVSACRKTEPKKLGQLLRGDLDWIVMKAMEKDRTRRYETVNGFAQDVQRYLRDEPVSACPPSASYRLAKFARRNRAALFTVAAVAVALVMGLVISTWQAVRATRAERLAQEESQNSKTEANRANAVVALLLKMLGSANPDDAKGADYTVRELLDDFSRGLDDQLQDQPEVEATIRATIGNAYRRLALPEQAEPHLKAALDLRRRIFGDGDEMVAESLLDYAFNFWEKDRKSPEAVALAREAAAIYRRQGGQTEEMIGALRHLHLFLGSQNKHAECDRVAREALAIAERLQIKDHPDVAIILHNMARNAAVRGDYVEAESLARKALAMHRKAHGDEHPETAWARSTLATTLRLAGKTNEAETHYRKAIQIFNRQFGGNYRGADKALTGLAMVLRAKGDDAEAESIWRETLALRRERFGDEHESVHRALSGLARVLQAGGDHAALEAVWREILAIRRKQFGEEHASVGIALQGIGFGLAGKGDHAEAVSYYRQAIAILRKSANDAKGQLKLADALVECGNLLDGMGQYSDARRHYQQAIPLFETLIEESSKEDVDSALAACTLHAKLGHAYLRTKDYEQALANICTAVELNPRDARGEVLQWMNNLPENEELQPWLARARRVLGLTDTPQPKPFEHDGAQRAPEEGEPQ